MNMTEEQKRKYIQYGGATIVIAVMIGGLSLLFVEEDKPKSVTVDEPKQIQLAQVTDGATESDLYRTHVGAELERQNKVIESLLAKEGDTYMELVERIEQLEKDREASEADAMAAIEALQAENKRLKDSIEAGNGQSQIAGGSTVGSRLNTGEVPQGELFAPAQGGTVRAGAGLPHTRSIEKVALTLSGAEGEGVPVYKTDSYIPAGSFVKARVVQGVAASVGIKASADPRPISFRLTGQAIGPARDGKPETYDLSGCVVTGAAQGDLSSERIYVRLLNLVCTKNKGEVFEVAVNGHAASQGQAGIRGQVVSREGEFTQKAFLAGLFGGLGRAGQQLSQPSASFSGGFAFADKTTAGEALGMGAGEGISQAGNRLSDYLMDRAEQYQPVIVVQTGVEVDLVFQKGVPLNVRS